MQKDTTNAKDYAKDYAKDVKNEVKDFAKDAKSYVAGAAKDLEGEYSEISDIRKDIQSLKENIASLAQHVKSDGKAKVGELKDAAAKRVDDVVAKGDESLMALDDQVKANPRQALLIAFAAGLITNFLLRSR